MIGVVIFGHSKLAVELAHAAESILGPQQALVPVGVEPEEGEAVIEARLREAMSGADGGRGVLLLTDMFGGTPMNFGAQYLESHGVEVVTGVNLAMLIKALTGRSQEVSLGELAGDVAEHGRRDISVASRVLRGEVAAEDEESRE